MGPNESEKRFVQATAILEQLLKYTSQLAAFENDRGGGCQRAFKGMHPEDRRP